MIRKAAAVAILTTAGLMAQAPLQSVVEAELSFARETAARGIKNGFLAYLAPDAVVFRPGPTAGREVYAKAAVSPASLTWYPVHADIAASGELGFTTGPYEYYESKDEKTAAAFGHYVTLWKKQFDGSWKAALDAGISHPKPLSKAPVFKTDPAALLPARSETRPTDQEEEALSAAEKGLAGDYVRKIGPLLAPGSRAYRDGGFPVVGKADVLALIARSAGSWNWSPAKITVAASGDLAYVYGTAERADGGTRSPHAYLRIWKKDPGKDWTVVLDLATSMQK